MKNRNAEIQAVEREYEKLEQDLLDNEHSYTQDKINTILAEMNRLQNEVARIAHPN